MLVVWIMSNQHDVDLERMTKLLRSVSSFQLSSCHSEQLGPFILCVCSNNMEMLLII